MPPSNSDHLMWRVFWQQHLLPSSFEMPADMSYYNSLGKTWKAIGAALIPGHLSFLDFSSSQCLKCGWKWCWGTLSAAAAVSKGTKTTLIPHTPPGWKSPPQVGFRWFLWGFTLRCHTVIGCWTRAKWGNILLTGKPDLQGTALCTPPCQGKTTHTAPHKPGVRAEKSRIACYVQR